MKILALAVLWAIVQATPTVPRQATDQQASETSKHHRKSIAQEKNATVPSTPSPEPIGTPQSNDKSNPAAISDTKQSIRISELPSVTVNTRPDWWSRAYVILTGILVIVGIFGVCYARRSLRAINHQLRAMRNQVREMQAQRREMHDQLEQMKAAGLQTDDLIKRASQQAIAMKASAKAGMFAARASLNGAEAASRNVEMFMRKERARIEVHPEAFDLKDSPDKIQEVRLHIEVHGATLAEIKEFKASAFVYGNSVSTPEYDEELTEHEGLPSIALPGSKFTPAIMTSPEIQWDQTTIDAVDCGSQYLHFVGFVRYEDVFGESHRTSWRLVWDSTMSHAFGLPGEWKKYGKPEDNEAN